MASEPTTTTHSPSSLLIRAPLSPEENENENDTRAGSDGGVSAEEDFETASDPDDEVLDSSLSPESALLPRRASMPKARVSWEDEVFEEELEAGDGDDGYGVARVSPADVVGENPSAVDGETNPGSEEGSGELPRASEPNSVDSGVGEKESVDSNLEEISKEGKDEKLIENQDESIETVVEPVDSGVGVEESQNPNPEESPKDGVLGFGGEDEKVGDKPKRVEKDDELKGGDGDDEAASPAVEGAQESKPVESVPVDEKKEDKVGVLLEKSVEAESNGDEADKAGAVDADVSEENSDKVNISTAENSELESNELNSCVVGVENNDEGVGGGSNSEAVPAVNAENLELESRELKSDVVKAENGGGLERDTVTEQTQAPQDSLPEVDPGNGSGDVVGVEGDEKGDILHKDSATEDAEVAVESGVSRNQDAGENNVTSLSEEAPSLPELSEGKLDALNESETVDSGKALNQDAGENKGVTQSEEVLADLHAKSNEGETEVVADDGGVVSSEEVESGPVLLEETKSRDVVFGDAKSLEADDDENVGDVEAEEEEEGLVSDGPARVAILESSETAKQIIKELEGGSSSNSSQSGFGSSRGYPNVIDGQIASDSDEEVDTDDEGDGKELFDSAALAALLKAATGGDGGITISSGDSTRIFSGDRPAGLGSSVSSLKPLPPRPARSNVFTPSNLAVTAEPENNMDEEEKKLHEKVEMVRVKFLRLIQRLGHSADDTVASQVLYRLSLAEGIKRGRHVLNRAPNLENARNKALQLEAEGKEDLDFSCNILVLGKSGVGKSATINSIFGEEKSKTSAFESATTSVKEISGIVDGVKICVIDTPGLKASAMEQQANRKILSSIKKYTKRCPPDIVLYVDRMDTQTRDFNDLPLLRSITSVLGSSIWFNAIVALTHAASAPPDGLNGTPLNYEVFIAQRSHVVQHSIRQAASDMRLMNPVALVENHPSCRRNREGEKVLPNGQSWRPQMLLLCYSSKILTEANSLLKLQDANPGKLFGFRMRGPPLPFLLSSLLQSRPHPKLSSDQGIDNGDSDIDLDDLSDSDQEDEEDEYDQLPPFKPLRKAQIAKLPKEQRKAYFEEYDYRVKLLQKKQWKEEIRRLKEMKKRGKGVPNEYAYGDMADDYEQDAAPAAVPVPLPDMVLPPTFDCDNPAYRYRFLEPTSQLLTRPVLDTHGWDHDCGYDGVSIEENLALLSRFPAGVSVQITKDKKDFNIHLDSSISAKHGENASTLAGLDIQTVGKQLAYILRSETKFKNFKKNKTTGGISVTFLGETVATGLKIEDQISIGRWLSLVASTGAIRAQGDTAYGGNLEVRLRDKDYPISQILTTLGLSLMRWRGDLALGANLQTQFPAGRNTKMVVRGSLNNKLTGQIAIKTSSSEQLPFALWGVIPMAFVLFRKICPGESYPMQ